MLKVLKSACKKLKEGRKIQEYTDEELIAIGGLFVLILPVACIGTGVLLHKGYDRIFWEQRCRKAFSEIDRRYPGAGLFLIKGRPGPLPYGLRLTYGPNKAGKEWLMGEWGTKDLDHFKTVIAELAKQVEDMN